MSALVVLILTAGASTTPRNEIVNGEEIGKNRFPSAVAIGFDGWGSPQSTCTASAITPKLLLTAAHCVDGISDTQWQQYGGAFIGKEVRTGQVQSVGFKRVIPHPGYVPTGAPQNDIALIQVQGSVPTELTWFADKPRADKRLIGAEVTSVGYGIVNSSSQWSSGIKRAATLVIDSVDEQFLYSYNSTNPNNSGICSGDSGGPQYQETKDGELIQVGVHSYGFAAGGDICLGASGSTRVDQYASWIYKHIERVHGTRDRCEINGHYGNGVCEDFCGEIDDDCIIDLDEDGFVSPDEFELADRNGDGVVDELELSRVGMACNNTGGMALGWLAWVPLLALRRRKK